MHIGMAAAKAQSLFRGLMMVDADLEADRVALERITLWALTVYSPIVAVDGIDGIVMDTEGADHLQGGELPMVTKIANQFLGRKLSARVAVADSWGAAHACVRAINRETIVIPLGETVRAVEKAIFTPGHSVGHQSFLVTLPNQKAILIAADAAYTLDHWNERALPALMSSAVDTAHSVRKLRAVADRTGALVVPGHDPNEWSRFRLAPAYLD